MKKFVILTTFGIALLSFGLAQAADIVPDVIMMPGTQPNEVGNFESPDKCDNCHGGYDEARVWSNEPAFGWRGGAMGNAGRDPIFWATLAVAEQDFDGAGDLCIRCHSAGGWYGGRSVPTDGSGLAASDDNGIDCDTCHAATNPDQTEILGVIGTVFEPYDTVTGEGYYGSGILALFNGSDKLGPYSDAEARHQFQQSQFHRGKICGSCHDVSNSAVGQLAPNAGTQPGAPAVIRSAELGYPLNQNLTPNDPAILDGMAAFNNPPYAYGIVERTFSEYMSSQISQTLISDYTSLPADLQIQGGALDFSYNAAMQAGTGGNYEDGTPRYFNCQGCHMRPDVGEGCNKAGVPTRGDLPKHDQSGGNYWMWPLIQYQDQQGTLRLGGGLTQTQIEAMDAGRRRAEQQLQMAANLEVFGNSVRITNLTGHKLISGYPEGRRMWLNIKWYDSSDNLVGEDGAYGPLGVSFENPKQPGQFFEPESILDLSGTNTKIYEVHPAIDQAWAQTLVGIGHTDTPVGFNRLTGAIDGTIGELASGALGPYAKSFHFVLNNYVADDNRIPPYGMDYEKARVRNALPVPDDQYGGVNGTPPSTYNYWDEIPLTPPDPTAVRADITLLYQGTSWEYVQFLWLASNCTDPNDPNQAEACATFLGQEGVNFLDAWINADPAAPMVPPFPMATATWGEACIPANEGPFGDPTCSDGVDNDCDNLIDSADPDCADCIPSGADNQCDGIDNDCNGFVDDGYVPTPTSCGVGECAGNTGQLACVDGSTVDTCDPLAGAVVEGPAGDPTCGDTLDNDCDGDTDAADADCVDMVCSDYGSKAECNNDPNCEWQGNPNTGTCVDVAGCTPTSPDEVGLCDDGIDNDCDGVTDCNDTADCGDDPVCQMDCSMYNKQRQCERNGCVWDVNTCINP